MTRTNRMVGLLASVDGAARELAGDDDDHTENLQALLSRGLKRKGTKNLRILKVLREHFERTNKREVKQARKMQAVLKNLNVNAVQAHSPEFRRQVNSLFANVGFTYKDAHEGIGLCKRQYTAAKNHRDVYGAGTPVPKKRRACVKRGGAEAAERVHKLNEWVAASALIQILPYQHHLAIYHRSPLTSALWKDYEAFTSEVPGLRFSRSYIEKLLNSGAFACFKSKTCVCGQCHHGTPSAPHYPTVLPHQHAQARARRSRPTSPPEHRAPHPRRARARHVSVAANAATLQASLATCAQGGRHWTR